MLDQVIVPRMRTPVRRLAYVLRTYQAKRNLQIMRLLVEQKASFPSMMAMLSKTRKGSSLKILQVTYIMKDKDLLFDAKKLQNQASRVIKELLLKERWGKNRKGKFFWIFYFWADD